MTTSRIFGIKLLLASAALLILLLLDAHTFARILQINNDAFSVLQLQLWGALFVLGGIIAGNSFLQFKKINYLRMSFYAIMALIFICLPLFIATSPYSMMELIFSN